MSTGGDLTTSLRRVATASPGVHHQPVVGTWASASLPAPLTVTVTSVAVRKDTQIDLVSQTAEGDDTTWQQASQGRAGGVPVRSYSERMSIRRW
jgi:hypothetical protein